MQQNSIQISFNSTFIFVFWKSMLISNIGKITIFATSENNFSIFQLLFYTYLLFMYFYMHHVCGHGGHMEVRGQAAVISSSLYHVGLRNWILVMRLGGKHLSTELSHYPNSTFQMYYSETSLKYCECFAAYFMLGKNPGSFFFFFNILMFSFLPKL